MAENTRLAFSRIGRSKYISHLDIMHTFQRAFYRAELPLRYTQGFNPHAYLSIALPLPVGVESVCERLDFGLEGKVDALAEKLSGTLPEGITVYRAMTAVRPFSEIAYVQYDILISGIGIDTLEDICRKPMIIDKKTKKGMVKIDITPMIASVSFTPKKDAVISNAVVCAQNPTLNPASITTALRIYGSENVKCKYLRRALFDKTMSPFDSAFDVVNVQLNPNKL